MENGIKKMITEIKKSFGLVGYPVSHSLSPAMHNAAFKYLGIDAEYKLFEKKPEELDEFFAKLSEQNIYGLNVTVPYKETVLKYLQWQSPEARFTQAVNTIIVKEKNYLKGWNTDGIGFYRHLTKDLKFNLLDKKVIVLGAGGASKAVVNQLARHGVKTIAIYDIDKDKSLKLTQKINKEFPKCSASFIDSINKLDIKNADLLINTTPIGMRETDPCLVKKEMLHKNLFVYDLVYNPPETKLLELAKNVGCKRNNGLGMLLYQGALSFKHFTGMDAPTEIMKKALEEQIDKLC